MLSQWQLGQPHDGNGQGHHPAATLIQSALAMARLNASWTPEMTISRNCSGTLARTFARPPTPPSSFAALDEPNCWASSAGTPAFAICLGISVPSADPKNEPAIASPTVPPT